MKQYNTPLAALPVEYYKNYWYGGLLLTIKSGFTFPQSESHANMVSKAGSQRSQVVRRQCAAFVQGSGLLKQGACLVYGIKYLCRHAGEDENGASYAYIYDLETKELLGVQIGLLERLATTSPRRPAAPKL